jgi:hypothetical protein
MIIFEESYKVARRKLHANGSAISLRSDLNLLVTCTLLCFALSFELQTG